MVTIRAYEPKDFEEVVDMYYKMILEVYPNRVFKDKQYFYINVMRWLQLNYDIMVTIKDDSIITGFCLCYPDNMGGICEDYYQAECVYIKPEFRKGRSAYLMYHSAVIYADKMNWIITTNASEITESYSLASKFGTKIFSNFERLPQKGD